MRLVVNKEPGTSQGDLDQFHMQLISRTFPPSVHLSRTSKYSNIYGLVCLVCSFVLCKYFAERYKGKRVIEVNLAMHYL